MTEKSGSETELESIDMCVNSPGNGVYLPGLIDGLDPPMAYFPLTGAITDSWPFPKFKATAETDARFVDDDVFGSVLDCRRVRLTYPPSASVLGSDQNKSICLCCCMCVSGKKRQGGPG